MGTDAITLETAIIISLLNGKQSHIEERNINVSLVQYLIRILESA